MRSRKEQRKLRELWDFMIRGSLRIIWKRKESRVGWTSTVLHRYVSSMTAATDSPINTHTHARTHTHPFNGPLSGTIRVSWYQKGKTNLDITEARDSEWQLYASLHLAPDR